MARKAKVTPHLRLRVEPPLLARLERSAEKNGRTLTGEIVDRLEASFKRDDMQGLMEATARRIAEKIAADVGRRIPMAAKRKIIDEETFEVDVQRLAEWYPNTPIEEHERVVREARARRVAKEGES